MILVIDIGNTTIAFTGIAGEDRGDGVLQGMDLKILFEAKLPTETGRDLPRFLKEAEQLRALERAVFAFDDVSFVKELVDDSLWKNSYKEHFKITEMADRLVVVPSWEEAHFEQEKDTTYLGKKPIRITRVATFSKFCIIFVVTEVICPSDFSLK